MGAEASEEACADKELGIVADSQPVEAAVSVTSAPFEVMEEEHGVAQLRDEPHPRTPSPQAGRGSLRGFGSCGKSFNYPSTVQRLEDGALGIVAGGETMAGISVVPAPFEVLEDGALGIVAGGEPMAGISVVPAPFEVLEDGALGIVAGGEPMAGISVVPAPFEVLEDGALGIVAGGEPMAGISVVPAPFEVLEDGALGIVAGGEPLLGALHSRRMISLFALIQNPLKLPLPACGEGVGGVGLIRPLCKALLQGLHTGRMIKTLCRILATPRSHLKAGCGTGGRTGGTPVLGPDMGTGGRTGVPPVLRQDVGASVWDGHLGQKQPSAGVREMGWLFGLCWRVWADSGGCWRSSI